MPVNPGVKPTSAAKLGSLNYWWLWVLDTMLVTGGFLFFLATRYGTWEFFGKALLMALLPLIPVMVLVGGAGSTVFALTKVFIEKRRLPRPTAIGLLVGQAVIVAVPLVLLGMFKSPTHRLAYICAGHAPAAAHEVQLTGYSTFLREEWLAVFRADAKSFQALVADAKLTPVDAFELKKFLEPSSLKEAKLFGQIPASDETKAFKRVFKEGEEHERGTIFAVFEPQSSTVAMFRGYRD